MSDIGGEVRLGSMLFTLVEPHRGHEVAYNRWYERDHFYAGCMVGPWLFAGPAVRRHPPAEGPPLRHRRRPVRRRRPRLVRRRSTGSSTAATTTTSTGRCARCSGCTPRPDVRRARPRPHAPVPPRLHGRGRGRRCGARRAGPRPPLRRRDRHARATGGRRDRRSSSAPTSRRTFAPELELGFTPDPAAAGRPRHPAGPRPASTDCLLNLSFTTASPATWWDEQRAAADRLVADGIGEMLWTAPFIPTIPGTDTYTDQLW